MLFRERSGRPNGGRRSGPSLSQRPATSASSIVPWMPAAAAAVSAATVASSAAPSSSLRGRKTQKASHSTSAK